MAIVFAAVYLLAMSVGAKKFDRYVLPIFPVIVLVAAIGIEGLVAFARDRDRLPKVHRGAMVAVSSLLVIVQALSMLTVSPYRLDYYNPILGGTRAAEDVLQMGWGQGGVEVVDTIEPLVPEGQSVVMQTSAVPSAFSYFLETDDSIRIESFGMSTPAGWYETDFYVAGIQQTQRDMAPSYRYLRDQAPFAIIDIGGVPYFSIFTPNTLPLPAHLQGDTACSGKFSGQVQLMQIIGRDQSIDFYWLSLDDGSASEDLTLQVSLVAPDGVISTAEVTWTMAPEGVMSKAHVTLDTHLAFPLEQYQLILSVTDVNGILPATGVDGVKTSDGEFQTHSECYYQSLEV